MSYNANATTGALVELLATGLPYSQVALRMGFADGRSMREARLTRGLKRAIRRGVVIVIAEPT